MLAEQFDAFLFDLDGVVYLGDEPLPHSREALARLREAGREIRFLTNDPRPTRQEVVCKLASMNVEVHEEEIITSGWATAEHLRKSGIRSVYVVGSEGLEAEIQRVGIEVSASGLPESVVVGADEHTSYHHIQRAARLISGGATFVATNPDDSFPTPDGPSPGVGAFVAAVTAACGKRPTVIGKPYPPMFEAAIGGLGAEMRIVMVGDNPETDVLGAHQAEIAAVLVSEDAPHFPSIRDFRVPDAVVPDLSSLFEPRVSACWWERSAFPWPDRVAAGVAAVVFDGSGSVLLVKRADNELWGLPSGHVELAESVTEAVEREVREETGIDTKVAKLIGVYSDPGSQTFAYPGGEVVQFVTCCFGCEMVGGLLRADAVETLDVRFFGVNELPEDLLYMHPRWLADALADEARCFVR